MPQIHCEYIDCSNNEESKCHAAAIRISKSECCLTYQPYVKGKSQKSGENGDRLLWDREYFEDDPLDDDTVM